ncbi:MAG: GGDEF domain-containing protein [Halarcobacter sp.]
MTKKITENFEIFPWNENLEIGIEEIDEQHKTIIELLNKLANSLTQDEAIEVEETFNELAKYADFHFKSEEKVWQKHIKDEELLKQHNHSHESFLPKVLELKEKNKDKNYNEAIEEILLFLIRWLAFHIVDEDKRFALVIKALEDGKSMQEAVFETESMMSGSMKSLIETILSMYDKLSIKTINLIRERKARLKAEKELRKINKKLEELSITDQLTKIYNRRYFDEQFEKELEEKKDTNTLISVMIFDIDYFKKLNDTYGHAKGDEALIKVSKALKQLCKDNSISVYRVGGEEFTILFTNKNEEEILTILDKLEDSIAELEIKNEGSTVSDYVTISGGLVSLIPTEESTIDSIMRLADERLYEAKKTGRNKIIYS